MAIHNAMSDEHQHLITENLALRVTLKEATKVIDQHCECSSDPEKKHRVWRYVRGKGNQWVPCNQCSAFREAAAKVPA